MRQTCLPRVLCGAIALLVPLHAQAIVIDGRVDPAEWAGARQIRDFAQVQPRTSAAPSQPTRAWIKALPEGLAVAFENLQPADTPRMRQHSRRDEEVLVDRINLMLDLIGDGRTGYSFSVTLAGGVADAVITSERVFSHDWDGDWRHAVREDEHGWSVEMLIPWHIAPLGNAADGKRGIGVYLDRVIGSTGERVAWPAASMERPRFLSEFAVIEVPHYEQPLLAVTPYAAGVHDRVAGDSRFDAGADLFWKPSGRLQLSATLNPDFGHVESDELVVNFSAVESFFGDKRPFFTENQGLFDVPFAANRSRLFYTRRIGGPADDGSGAGDVRAAIKLNGSLGETQYGVFAASEGGAAGRDFHALRAVRGFGSHSLGGMLTRVERPFLDRTATVHSVDHAWSPGAGLNISSTVVASRIEQRGVRVDGFGFQSLVNHELGGGWRQQIYLLHSGEDLQLNDIGYLDRNDFNYLRYEIAQRVTGLPADSSDASRLWQYAVSTRTDAGGRLLGHAWKLTRTSEHRDGGTTMMSASGMGSNREDRITRGHGDVRLPAKLFLHYQRSSPRRGRWSFFTNVFSAGDGLDGMSGMSLQLLMQPTLHFNDSLRLQGTFVLDHNPDWLLWRGGNRLGSFRSDRFTLASALQWRIDDRQELSVKLQAIALDARLRQAWRVGADGHPVAVDEPIPDFNLRNLGFQIRYRYELAPLSHLYVVYGRGGLALEEGSRPLDEVLADAFSLRDDEQLMVKLSYRFVL